MKDKVQQILSEIIKVHGISVIAEKGRFKGMLLDRMNAPSKEVRAILECVNSGIGEEIISNHSDNLAGRIHIWKYKLVEEIGLQESLVVWALETLITVCDKKIPTKTNVPVTKESKPATSVSKKEEITKPKDVQKVVVDDTKYGTFTDPRDGKVYKTVKIGSQIWMAENLSLVTKDSWYYDNNSDNGKKYGRLYTWETANKIAPSGWHLPSKEEFEILLSKNGGKGKNAYQKMIQGGSSGFDALFGGWRSNGHFYYQLKTYANFWSSSRIDSINAWSMYFQGSNQKTSLGSYNQYNAFSARCIKD